MNILFINSIGKKKFGGGEKWMILSAKGLAAKGHNVFLAAKSNSEFIKTAQKVGIKTFTFNIWTDFSPVNTWRIVRFLKNENIQFLICNLNKDVRVAGLAAKLIKTTTVIARHGLLVFNNRKWRYRLTAKYLIDGIITNTETIKQSYLNYNWFADDFIKVIYNCVEDKADVIGHDFETRFPGKKIVFSAGRLSYQKGFDTLIAAAAYLKKKRRDLIFVIAGKGRLLRRLKTLAKKLQVESNIVFSGHRENIDPFLKGCGLFVLSSRFEGMPNVVMEAMAVGKAVVATDVNGVRELMIEQQTGLIVPPDDPFLLADSIDNLIDNKQLLSTMGQAGQRRVQDIFTTSKMIRNLEAYLVDLLKRRDERNPK